VCFRGYNGFFETAYSSVLKKSAEDVLTSFRRTPESRMLSIRQESNFWTLAFAGVTHHFSTVG
jgi:hypothetical protein